MIEGNCGEWHAEGQLSKASGTRSEVNSEVIVAGLSQQGLLGAPLDASKAKAEHYVMQGMALEVVLKCMRQLTERWWKNVICPMRRLFL